MNAIDLFLGNVETITCCKCGLTFGVPKAWVDDRRAKRDGFSCPNKHDLVFNGPSEADTLRKQLEQKDRALQAKDQQLEHHRSRARSLERSRNAYRGQLTRAKRRAEGGTP